eukprot:1764133-Prymnesium_polylepis.1
MADARWVTNTSHPRACRDEAYCGHWVPGATSFELPRLALPISVLTRCSQSSSRCPSSTSTM